MSSCRLRLAVPLAALALAVSACGFKSEPVGVLPSFPRTADDGQGRSVTVAAQPTRIVSLDPGLTETAFAVGAGADVVGATGTESYPPAARRLPVAVSSDGKPEHGEDSPAAPGPDPRSGIAGGRGGGPRVAASTSPSTSAATEGSPTSSMTSPRSAC